MPDSSCMAGLLVVHTDPQLPGHGGAVGPVLEAGHVQAAERLRWGVVAPGPEAGEAVYVHSQAQLGRDQGADQPEARGWAVAHVVGKTRMA
eukprot:scaffold75281_cov32-Prasinocladus_malaysianus.AAC.1